MNGNKIRGIIMLALVIVCPIVLAVVCAGAVFGWYTHIEQVGELHGDTSNVNLHYYINDSEKLNPSTLSVISLSLILMHQRKQDSLMICVMRLI